MPWNFDENTPVYMQIISEVKHRILKGEYAPGSRLPSVRELAVEAAVNPNTMQRALAELEKAGLIHSERTTGRFVTDDMELIRALKDEQANAIIYEMLSRLWDTGMTNAEILENIGRKLKE